MLVCGRSIRPLVHTRHGISLHVPRLHSDGAPGPRLPIRACTPGQKINRLVGRCRSTPCDPHEQIYRYIVHSAPREPHHSLIPGPGRSVLHTLVPTCPLLAGAPFCPVIRGRSAFKTLSGLEVGGVPRVRRMRSRTSRHMRGLWPTCFARQWCPHIMTEVPRRSSDFRHRRCILCGRGFVFI